MILGFRNWMLFEAGDTVKDFVHTSYGYSPEDMQHVYTFRHNNDKYIMDIHHNDIGHAYIEFGNFSKPRGFQHKVTNDKSHEAVKILSSVHNILKHHAKNHPEINQFNFDATHKEPSRVKLYQAYARKMGGTYNPQKDGSESFNIPADEYRK